MAWQTGSAEAGIPAARPRVSRKAARTGRRSEAKRVLMIMSFLLRFVVHVSICPLRCMERRKVSATVTWQRSGVTLLSTRGSRELQAGGPLQVSFPSMTDNSRASSRESQPPAIDSLREVFGDI